MLILFMGGAASGKSDCAERMAVSSGAEKKYYIATMKPVGDGAAERIEKHRKRRTDKDFTTIECPLHPESVNITGEYDNTLILLEDLGNLVANEQFDAGGTDEEITERVLAGIASLCNRAGYVYIVGDDIFSDTADYDADTLRYMRLLGKVTEMTARLADIVLQVTCGIALPLKERIPGDTEYGKE